MAKTCRHKKGIILASALNVDFTPDQEPFEADVIESSGYSAINLEYIDIGWCPKCKVLKWIESNGQAEGVRE